MSSPGIEHGLRELRGGCYPPNSRLREVGGRARSLLSRINATTRTHLLATWLVAAATLLLAPLLSDRISGRGDRATVADRLRLRQRGADQNKDRPPATAPDAFVVRPWVPVVGLATSLTLLLTEFLH